jgi:hypothetical protein
VHNDFGFSALKLYVILLHSLNCIFMRATDYMTNSAIKQSIVRNEDFSFLTINFIEDYDWHVIRARLGRKAGILSV